MKPVGVQPPRPDAVGRGSSHTPGGSAPDGGEGRRQRLRRSLGKISRGGSGDEREGLAAKDRAPPETQPLPLPPNTGKDATPSFASAAGGPAMAVAPEPTGGPAEDEPTVAVATHRAHAKPPPVAPEMMRDRRISSRLHPSEEDGANQNSSEKRDEPRPPPRRGRNAPHPAVGADSANRGGGRSRSVSSHPAPRERASRERSPSFPFLPALPACSSSAAAASSSCARAKVGSVAEASAAPPCAVAAAAQAVVAGKQTNGCLASSADATGVSATADDPTRLANSTTTVARPDVIAAAAAASPPTTIIGRRSPRQQTGSKDVVPVTEPPKTVRGQRSQTAATISIARAVQRTCVVSSLTAYLSHHGGFVVSTLRIFDGRAIGRRRALLRRVRRRTVRRRLTVAARRAPRRRAWRRRTQQPAARPAPPATPAARPQMGLRRRRQPTPRRPRNHRRWT